MKSSLPYGQLPVLEVTDENGVAKFLGQSGAILSYVAKMGTGTIVPSDPFLAAVAEEVADEVEDGNSALFANPAISGNKAAYREKLATELLPARLTKIEKRLVAVGTTPGFAVGDNITMADLKLYGFCGTLACGLLDGIPTDIVSPALYPTITACVATVRAHPKVQEYLAASAAKTA
ncbi:unnamed protein product [Phaeothamnion confervicola]